MDWKSAVKISIPVCQVWPRCLQPQVLRWGHSRYVTRNCSRLDQNSILSIHPPNELSGIYNAARLAAEEFGQRVKVLDSGQVSLGLGYQVLLAAEAAAKGAIQDEVLIPGGKRTQTRTANGAFGYRRICSSERASCLGGCNDRRGSAAPTIN